MAELPTSIAVGRWVYSVSEDAQQWAEFGAFGTTEATQFGLTNHHQLRIVLNPGVAPRQKADTLLHEVLHCIWEVGAVTKRKEMADGVDAEELTIGQLTPWLALVLVENPDLVTYLDDPE
jgi:hypothetical protein